MCARGVAAPLWCAAPRRAPRLTGDQGKPVKYVVISEHWYYLRGVGWPAAAAMVRASSRISPRSSSSS
jgi:hypothetical protein